MSGPAIARAVLVGHAGLTALVPAERIVADEVTEQGLALPFVLLKHVSGVDMNLPVNAGKIFTRKRVQAEVHAKTAPQRKAIKKAIRSAGLSNPRPIVPGYSSVTLFTEAEGPDFTVGETLVRIGEQDFMITYSEEI